MRILLFFLVFLIIFNCLLLYFFGKNIGLICDLLNELFDWELVFLMFRWILIRLFIVGILRLFFLFLIFFNIFLYRVVKFWVFFFLSKRVGEKVIFGFEIVLFGFLIKWL